MKRTSRKLSKRIRAMLVPARALQCKDDLKETADYYFVHPYAGRFHVAYLLAGSITPASVVDCLLEVTARRECRTMNADRVRNAPAPYLKPENRSIVPGFYSNQMDLI